MTTIRPSEYCCTAAVAVAALSLSHSSQSDTTIKQPNDQTTTRQPLALATQQYMHTHAAAVQHALHFLLRLHRCPLLPSNQACHRDWTAVSDGITNFYLNTSLECTSTRQQQLYRPAAKPPLCCGERRLPEPRRWSCGCWPGGSGGIAEAPFPISPDSRPFWGWIIVVERLPAAAPAAAEVGETPASLLVEGGLLRRAISSSRFESILITEVPVVPSTPHPCA